MTRSRSTTDRRDSDTPEHLALHAKLRRSHKLISRLAPQIEAAYAERAALFIAGRQLDPPEPYARLAAFAGVTEAAVIQVLTRNKASSGNGDGGTS